MGKGRRTKKQKLTAKRVGVVYSLPKNEQVPDRQVAVAERAKNYDPLFAYDPRLILTDLTKTVVLSILAVATIVAVYYFKII